MAGWEPTPEFLEAQPEEVRELLAGRPYWTWPERHRRLGTPAGAGGAYKPRMWSVSHSDSRWKNPPEAVDDRDARRLDRLDGAQGAR